MTPQAIVRADGLFETALGLVLVAGAAAGWLDAADFPAPVGTTVIVVFGCALVAVGAVLWRLAARPVPAALLRNLATANLATAAAALTWLLAADGFSTTGSAITAAAVAALTALAAGQLRTMMSCPS